MPCPFPPPPQCKLNASVHEAVRVHASKTLAALSASPVDGIENSRPSERSPPRVTAPPRAVILKVAGLDTTEGRNSIIKCLLGVKGVTSVTIDQRKGHAVVYTHKGDDIRPSLNDAIRSAEADKVCSARFAFLLTCPPVCV